MGTIGIDRLCHVCLACACLCQFVSAVSAEICSILTDCRRLQFVLCILSVQVQTAAACSTQTTGVTQLWIWDLHDTSSHISNILSGGCFSPPFVTLYVTLFISLFHLTLPSLIFPHLLSCLLALPCHALSIRTKCAAEIAGGVLRVLVGFCFFFRVTPCSGLEKGIWAQLKQWNWRFAELGICQQQHPCRTPCNTWRYFHTA